MNEHIKEMARQAGGIDMTNHVAGGITTWIGTGTSEFIEHFAESIVNECLMKVHGAQIRNESYSELIERIKRDFGVEE